MGSVSGLKGRSFTNNPLPFSFSRYLKVNAFHEFESSWRCEGISSC
uniref:Uncharacterized protein n=1 Tax=Brassica campestris TaxID=3711 RepID=A0A3P6B980_BRACM|nr:unnamed protein product [Brassica rapa]